MSLYRRKPAPARPTGFELERMVTAMKRILAALLLTAVIVLGLGGAGIAHSQVATPKPTAKPKATATPKPTAKPAVKVQDDSK